MAQKPVISCAQAQAAIKAMLDKAMLAPNEPVALAIMDDSGNLVAYAHMDNLRLFSRRHSLRKAYTAAVMGGDSGANAERMKAQGRTVLEFGGDLNMTPGQGGLVVRSKDGIIMGGIGVGGYPSGQTDEDLARVGLAAMKI